MNALTIFTCGALMAIAVPSWAQKNSSQGPTIFQEQCIGCHGQDGRADTDMGKKVQAADLTSEAVQQQSASQLEKVVKNGQKKMPSFAGKLSDDEIKAVVTYVKQLGGK